MCTPSSCIYLLLNSNAITNKELSNQHCDITRQASYNFISKRGCIDFFTISEIVSCKYIIDNSHLKKNYHKKAYTRNYQTQTKFWDILFPTWEFGSCFYPPNI